MDQAWLGPIAENSSERKASAKQTLPPGTARFRFLLEGFLEALRHGRRDGGLRRIITEHLLGCGKLPVFGLVLMAECAKALTVI